MNQAYIQTQDHLYFINDFEIGLAFKRKLKLVEVLNIKKIKLKLEPSLKYMYKKKRNVFR